MTTSFGGFHPDPVLDDLSGLPVYELLFGKAPCLELAALNLLAQREHVGIEYLLLAWLLLCAGPGRPSEFVDDVPGWIERVDLSQILVRPDLLR